LTETDLVKDIVEALEVRFTPSVWIKIHGHQFQAAGIPDLVGCCIGRFIGIEVKLPGTKLQQYWVKLINKCGGHATMVTTVDQAVSFVARALKKG